jgi:hypothetical protein
VKKEKREERKAEIELDRKVTNVLVFLGAFAVAFYYQKNKKNGGLF